MSELNNIGIGIIGLGRAGCARLVALTSLGFKVNAICSKRPIPDQLLLPSDDQARPTIYTDWRALLLDDDVKFVFICSETQAHATQIKYALEQGKHVCVDFPTCTTESDARALYALAQRRNLVLHTEVIGTLTASHLRLREALNSKEISSWHTELSGGLYRWVRDLNQSREWGVLIFGRLYQIVDLLSEPVIVNGRRVTVGRAGEVISTTLQISMTCLETQQYVEVIEERSVDFRRARKSYYYDDRGREVSLEHSPSNTSLFLLDTEHFFACCDVIQEGFIKEYSIPEAIIRTHRLADETTRKLQ